MFTFTLDWLLVLPFIIGTVLPLLVGLVTTRLTASKWQALLLLALSIITTVATQLFEALRDQTELNLGVVLLVSLGTFITGAVTHGHLWKPTGVSAKAQAVLVTAPKHAE